MPKRYLTPKVIKLVAALSVCALFIYINPKNLFNPVRNILFTVSYPFQKAGYLVSLRVQETVGFIGSISSLRSENARLIKENNVLTAEIAGLKAEKEENKHLREQLDLVPKGESELEASFVIGQDPQKTGSWIVIDKGSSDQIETGMPVIISNNILVGKVSEVYAHSAKINLLTDSASAINALDLETSAKGIIAGEYGLGVMMGMVAQTDVLNEGDTIVTSGLGGNMPKGLLIGTVQEVKNSADKLFQEALISPRVKYSKLDVVFVVKGQK